MVASPALVVEMQDNEYTDAQVGDAGGLFKSLDPAPCGAVPAYLIQCCSSSLPHPVLWFHAVCLIHCSGSILPHPMFQFQSTSSSTPVQKTLISLVVYFCFCTIFFFQISPFLSPFFIVIIFFTLLLIFAIFHIIIHYLSLIYTTIVIVTSCVSDFTQ